MKLRCAGLGLSLSLLIACTTPPQRAPQAPPPERVETRPPKPGPDVFWQQGHWTWRESEGVYYWSQGGWAPEREGFLWMPGTWRPVDTGGARQWEWVPERWVDLKDE